MAFVYMSGYADFTEEALQDNRVRFLQKPFAPDAVLRTIRDVLDTPQRRAAETQPLSPPFRLISGPSPTAQFT
jgi:DNA-binding NtrC family response regulator